MVRLTATLFASATLVAVAAFDNTVFLIRHGEKPPNDGQGLSPAGKERAQCLPSVFGQSSPYDIGYILAEQPQKDGDRTRPVDTVTPLAQSLGLTVDTSCDRDDPDCVNDAVNKFVKTSTKNVLICWEHKRLSDIMESLGVHDPAEYPSDSFNVIFTVQNQKLISDNVSENCTGLDN